MNDVTKLREQLSEDWNDILEGIATRGFLEQLTVELARPNLGKQLSQNTNEWLAIPVGDARLQHQAKSIPIMDKIEQNHHKYVHLFRPDRMKVTWTNIEMKSYSDGEKYCSKGAFLCRLIDCEFEFAFFEARRGSCGFNNCSSGKSYCILYIGTFDDIYEYVLTDKYREIIGPREKLS